MRSGLVSTIIPVYNRPALVVEAIESVLTQTYRPIEIIVVDDGSTDSTAAVVEQMIAAHPEISLVRQPNSGPGPARQKGIEAASGEFIQFLDSDDLLCDTKFELQVGALRENPKSDIAYGKTSYLKNSGERLLPWLCTGMEFETWFPAMLRGRIWGTSTPLYRSELFPAAGPFTALSNEEDWEMDCRIASLGARLVLVDAWASEEREVAVIRASNDGGSDPKKLRDRAKARELILGHALLADVSPESDEFTAFVKGSFLVARQCAGVGLVKEAEELVRHLNKAAPRKLMSLYLLTGKYIGFQRTTHIAEGAHRILRRDRERAGL